MRELTAQEAGRIIAALEAYGDDHPDAEEAGEYFALAELVAENAVYVEEEPA